MKITSWRSLVYLDDHFRDDGHMYGIPGLIACVLHRWAKEWGGPEDTWLIQDLVEAVNICASFRGVPASKFWACADLRDLLSK